MADQRIALTRSIVVQLQGRPQGVPAQFTMISGDKFKLDVTRIEDGVIFGNNKIVFINNIETLEIF